MEVFCARVKSIDCDWQCWKKSCRVYSLHLQDTFPVDSFEQSGSHVMMMRDSYMPSAGGPGTLVKQRIHIVGASLDKQVVTFSI